VIVGNTPRRWLPLVGAIVVLTLAACGDDTPAATTAVTAESTATTADGTGTASTAAPRDAVLGDALDAVGTRYAFTATVTLDGAEVTMVEGTVYDGTGAYQVAAAGATVEYVASDEGQWARQPGGEWTVLSEAAPLLDPLDPLSRPIDVRVLDSSGDDALLEATYDGATLGFAGGGRVDVSITITGGAVAAISYDVTVEGGTATVVTTFDGTADVSPIQVPPT